MRISLKHLDLICLAAIIVVAGMGGYWVVKKGVKRQTSIQQANTMHAGSLKNMNMADSSLQQLRKGLATVKSELKTLNERIPPAAEIGKFLKQLDAHIKQRNITLITLQPKPAEKERYVTKIPIRLMFKGAFNDLYDLIRDLETMKRVLVTEKMTITKIGSGEQCRVDMTISIFGLCSKIAKEEL